MPNIESKNNTIILPVESSKYIKQDQCRAVCTEIRSKNGQRIKIFAKKALDVTSKIALEALKISAVVTALTVFVILTTPPPLVPFGIYVVVVGPALEELAFRGIIQNIIKAFQSAYNSFIRTNPPTKQDLQHQQKIRIGISAALFGVAHLTNPTGLVGKIFQVTKCTIAGVSLGYTMEKTHSLALPILDHGINNGIVMLGVSNPALVVPLLILNTGVFIYNTIATYKDNPTVAEQIGQRVGHEVEACGKLIRNVAEKVKNLINTPRHQVIAVAA